MMHNRVTSYVLSFALCVSLLIGAQSPVAAATGGYPYHDSPSCATGNCVADEWGFYKRECVSFVAWKLNAINGIAFKNKAPSGIYGNASNWTNRARAEGFSVNTSPAKGAVAWWNFGHVAWVTSVSSDGSIVHIEEYNYDYL